MIKKTNLNYSINNNKKSSLNKIEVQIKGRKTIINKENQLIKIKIFKKIYNNLVQEFQNNQPDSLNKCVMRHHHQMRRFNCTKVLRISLRKSI